MFKKTNKNAIVKMNYKTEGRGGSSTTIPLKDGELLTYLKKQIERHHELVITNITDNEIDLTSSRTVEYHELEARVDEVGDLIRNYVKSRALKQNAYAVFARGELKGVFGQIYNSNFKRSSLLREGFKKEEIEIKPIKIESFDDIL